MTALYPQDWHAYLQVSLVFLRLMGFFLLLPGFSHEAIPSTVKILLGLSLSLAFYPIVQSYLPAFPDTWSGIVAAVLRETTLGLLMGFSAYVTFEAINLAAQFVGYQIGFGTASLVDPQNQSSVSIFVPLHSWIALMIFFFSNMHYDMIRLFVLSFQITHRMQDTLLQNVNLLNYIVALTAKLFVLAVQMAAPFTVLVLSSNVAVGILSRMMPQMNVILFTFPITILLGFATLYLLAPDLMEYLNNVLGLMSSDVMGMLKTL